MAGIRRPSVSYESDRANHKRERGIAPIKHGPQTSVTPPVSVVKPNLPEKRPQPRTADVVPSGSVTFSFSVKIPATGEFEAFDRIATAKGAEYTFRKLLRKALDQFEPVLLSGKVPAVKSFKTASSEVHTTRTISAHAYQIAQDHFDPFGIESRRTIARQLAITAFSHYMQTFRLGTK